MDKYYSLDKNSIINWALDKNPCYVSASFTYPHTQGPYNVPHTAKQQRCKIYTRFSVSVHPVSILSFLVTVGLHTQTYG